MQKFLADAQAWAGAHPKATACIAACLFGFCLAWVLK